LIILFKLLQQKAVKLYIFDQANWQEAWDFCCSFDMKLLSMEKSLTLGCITKLSIRKLTFSNSLTQSSLVLRPGYHSTSGVDLWTSGMGTGCQSKYAWCGKKLMPQFDEVNWAQGQPDQIAGECAFVRFSNSSVNESVMALGNCSQKLNFVCEVRINCLQIFPKHENVDFREPKETLRLILSRMNA
jgi:hypothetical protein